ncbi:MAG: TlpA disulfide reductase family protein [Methylophilaceae bacterium]
MRKHVLLLLLFFICSMAHAADELVLKDMSGAEHRLSQYAGKWVIINYWATWCPPCLEEIPEFVALYDERKNKDVMVIGVVFDYSSIKTVSDYVDDMLISYSIVLGNDNIVKQIGSADVLPTTYFFNPKGVLVKVKRGLVSRQYLEAVMREQ